MSTKDLLQGREHVWIFFFCVSLSDQEAEKVNLFYPEEVSYLH